MIGDYDAYPSYDVQSQHNIGGLTHVAAPGVGLRVVILAAIFSSAAVAQLALLNGAQVLTRIDIDAADIVFGHNPYGWFVLDENTPLTVGAACSSTVKYKVIPV